MDRIRTSLMIVFALSLIGALSLGCNTGTEEPDAPATEAPAEAAADTTDATDATEAPPIASQDIDRSRFPELIEGVRAEIPENYPEDLPIYPGSVPAQGRGSSDDDGDIAAVQFLTNDPPERTFDNYKGQLESKGWVIGKAATESGTGAISATKDGCKATFMFVPSETGTGTDIFTISACADDL